MNDRFVRPTRPTRATPAQPTHSLRRSVLRRSQAGGIGLTLAILLVLGATAAYLATQLGGDADANRARHSLGPPLARGRLELAFVEKGSLTSIDAHDVVCRVQGSTTLLYVVPEGRIVTAEDVAEGLVLVQLDSSELKTRAQKQAIDVQSAEAGLEAARSALAIQRAQNESDLRRAALAVRFARLDLERYVGRTLAARLEAERMGVFADMGDAETPHLESASEGDGPPGAAPRGALLDVEQMAVRLAQLLQDEALDGEVLQRRRELESEIRLADEERERAQNKVNHSERLEGKGFISREELEADRLALQRRTIEAERARTARDQFVAYDFPKECQRLFSEWIEAREDERRAVEKAAASLANAKAEESAREQQAQLQLQHQAELQEQIERCTIRATVPGLVVYGAPGRGRHWDEDERIREGLKVREGQILLTIPQADRIAASVNVHESAIRRVRVGLSATVIVDTMPDQVFEARVREVSRMPAAANWYNRDQKVYATVVELLGNHPTLKPGESCSVSVRTDDVDDALAVPVQAIVGTPGAPALWVGDDSGHIERRSVVLGPSNDVLVQVVSGVQPGERVVLDPPLDTERQLGDGSPDGEQGVPDADGPPAGGRSKDPASGGAAGPTEEQRAAQRAGPRGETRRGGGPRRGEGGSASAAAGAEADKPAPAPAGTPQDGGTR